MDFKEFINLILKNKLFLISITGFSILISFIYVTLKPKVWEGGFQIVLNNKKNPGVFPSGLSDSNKNYLSMAGIDLGGKSDIKTEVGNIKKSFNFNAYI